MVGKSSILRLKSKNINFSILRKVKYVHCNPKAMTKGMRQRNTVKTIADKSRWIISPKSKHNDTYIKRK